jgi:hypothetical protein
MPMRWMRALWMPALLLCTGCVVQPPPPPPLPAPPPQAEAAPQQQCREFNTPVTIGGQTQQAYGTACLQADGSWKVQQSVAGQPPQTYVVPPQPYQAYYPPAYAANPWYYGPPLFVGGVFIGGGWGYGHHHDGWHGAWRHGHWH